MGAKDSKQTYISYEEAVERLSEREFRQIYTAACSLGSEEGLPRRTFLRHVLGGVPTASAEVIYSACGGSSKSISFKDMLCALVVLAKGTDDEIVRFLFNVYSLESEPLVTRTSLLQVVQRCEARSTVDAIDQLFHVKEAVGFDEFRQWIVSHRRATQLSTWLLACDSTLLLSSDREIPTFCQSLAGVTHLEKSEILELEQRYCCLRNESPSDEFDRELFHKLVGRQLPNPRLVKSFFDAFDENCDGHIDFKEMACGISAACRGPLAERHKFFFRLFDLDRDSCLNRTELKTMVDSLNSLSSEALTPDCDATVRSILSRSESGDFVTQEEFLMWSLESTLLDHFVDLLFLLCHVLLGLRPRDWREECQVVIGWLCRQEALAHEVGALWCLVDIRWWRAWCQYVGHQAEPPLSASLLRSASADSLNRFASRDASGNRVLARDNGTVCMAGSFSSVGGGGGGGDRECCVRGKRPGRIDNSSLVQPSLYKVPHLTSEGGRLRDDANLRLGIDFELVPMSLWNVLELWYGGGPKLTRVVIKASENDDTELELMPLSLRLLRHRTRSSTSDSVTATLQRSLRDNLGISSNSFLELLGGGGVVGGAFATSASPKRYLAYTGAFTRRFTVERMVEFLSYKLLIPIDDMRLWHIQDDSEGSTMTLWENESCTLEQLGVCDNDKVLVEVRSADQTWPEEMCTISSLGDAEHKSAPIAPGVTGLANLGNTCYMNTALQCCSNTGILTRYFTQNMHLYEINRYNPIGMNGFMAIHYGDLIQNIWRGATKVIAPIKLRCTIVRFSSRFSGFQQHDAQELLSFLLDGLHEDLNRVYDKPYVELRDSEGRSDVIVAREAWDNHNLRNRSIIVDLFHGQLKSMVTCRSCGHESVRFDAFNMLSLPLSVDDVNTVQIILVRMDNSIPTRYAVQLSARATVLRLKQLLLQMAALGSSSSLLICEVNKGGINFVLSDSLLVNKNALHLHAFEIPSCISRMQAASGAPSGVFHSNHAASELENSAEPSGTPLTSEAESLASSEPTVSDVSAESTSRYLSDDDILAMADSLHCQKGGSECRAAAAAAAAAPCCCVDVVTRAPGIGCQRHGYIVAYHRKLEQQETYLVATQKDRPLLFGLPVIVSVNFGPGARTLSGAALYDAVWSQVSRLVMPTQAHMGSDSQLASCSVSNHAHADTLGYRYPFVLRCVQSGGLVCRVCPWYMFCRGCPLPSDETSPLPTPLPSFVAIDWEPTVLHLRYLTIEEKRCVDHPSVQESLRRQNDSIDLHQCLETFTREETLGEQEKYYCARCCSHQPALKKLQIWRLPPLLIIHLKRFQFANDRWIKSRKRVEFPFVNFDPTDYLASVPRQTILHNRAKQGDLSPHSSQLDLNVLASTPSSPSSSPSQTTTTATTTNVPSSASSSPHVPFSSSASSPPSSLRFSSCSSSGASSLSKSAARGSDHGSVGCGAALQDFHQHRLLSAVDPLRPLYRLYALSCHTGKLSSGHYVCYAKHPQGHWYCYNDSACKRVLESAIDTKSAYLLFYEREGLDCDSYMPEVVGEPVDKDELLEECEADFKSSCSLT